MTLLGQVVLLRELCVACYGSELAYLLGLGAVMTGTALGALAGQRWPASSQEQPRFLLLFLAILLPASAVVARLLTVLFHGTPGAFLPFPEQLAGAFFAMSPAGFVGGLLFQRCAAISAGEKTSLARAYAIESLGSMAGGAASALLLAFGVSNFSAGLLCGAASLPVALLPRNGNRRRWLWVFAAPAIVILAASFAFAGKIDRGLNGLTHPGVVLQKDTPYGRLLVTRSEGQMAVFLNGALAYESQGTSAEEFVHPATLEVACPDAVLIMGGATSGLAAEVLRHHPKRVVDVELDAALVDGISPFLPPESREALADKRVKVEIADPRRYLENNGQWDLILCAMPGPDSLGANRFYTREFFERCKNRLLPGGVLAFRLQSAENLWTPLMLQRAASIHGALSSVFADTLVLPGTTNLYMASMSRLAREPELLAARYQERGIEARLVTPQYIRYLLTNDRTAEVASLLASTKAEANSDARPVCYPLALLLHLSRLFPRLGTIALPRPETFSPWLWGAAIIATAMIFITRKNKRASALILAAAAGFSGMVLETGLLLAYQSSRGALFQEIGLLLTLFMAGLSAGAAAAGRFAPRQAWFNWAASLALASTAALAAICVRSGVAWNIFSAGALILCAGFSSGCLFGVAAFMREKAGGAIYGADLIGGVIGAIGGGAIMLPFFGLAPSALFVAAIALASTAPRMK
ncbi:MAG: hypothetical protein JHC34_01500 [Acidobacteria bacterium]|nr:hypothetical protein [Acidobacteriota bacterium]